MRASGFLLIIILCSGCAKVPPADDYYISSVIETRTNHPVAWDRSGIQSNQSIPDNLTCDEAISAALLHNPEIQSLFEEVGIVHADLIQAGLLHNPVFDGIVRFPHTKHATTFTEFSLIQNVLDLLLIPLRKKVASTELERAQLAAAHGILAIIFDIRETYYKLQAEQANFELMKQVVETTEAAAELARGQRNVGNINDLEFQNRMNEYLETKVMLTKNRIELIHLREKMDKLLGIRTMDSCWNIRDPLPELPDEEPPRDCLIEIALAKRLDLQAARMELHKIACTFDVKQWWTYTEANLGVSTERDSEGTKETGPVLSLELPLFNYGQADRARLRSFFRQSLDRIQTIEISVLAEVRAAHDRLIAYRELVLEYKNEIIPLQQEIASTAQKHYNSMTLSVYKLLQAKKQELITQMDYNAALRDYWISKVALDRALGGHE